ncbi:hypothetical protein RHS01_07199 [Rhizoctonia solani]|uniref:Uncharacterized protein n=1 Tax=Rhizoctonia solani TaxID=456999 RepID=A0A8H7LZT7_9AGAM|nr:hypothetical protein RHS01_07199 [Rhizoctonia solani]
MIIDFEGSAVWLYGPPRSQVSIIPVEYKICLRENHHMASDVLCYRVNVAEAYSHEDNYESPVVIFAKGDLQPHEHRIVISVAEPVGEVSQYQGIQFSHAVYTTERPTPWPVEQDAWRFRQVIMHDTHPLLSYWPREPVSSGSSKIPFEFGWSPKTYTAEDGSRVTWHELRSRDQENRDRWGVDATIKAAAGVVELYGVPKAHITDTDYLSPICVRINSGNCEIVDLKHAYLETIIDTKQYCSGKMMLSIRISGLTLLFGWSNQRGKTCPFPFKEIRYFEKQEYSRDIASPDLPSVQTKTVSVWHDVQRFYPGRRCLAGQDGGVQTGSTRGSGKKPRKGSRIGARSGPEGFIRIGGTRLRSTEIASKRPVASQHVCINDVCHLIDAEQAYLMLRLVLSNPLLSTPQLRRYPPNSNPFLLWSQTGLDDQTQHTLRLALAPLHSQDDAEMTIAKITYEVLGHSRPDTPIPPPDESYEGHCSHLCGEMGAETSIAAAKHEPKPEPVPHPQPSTSIPPEPEPTYPSTAHPVPTGPGSTHPHPLPSPEQSPNRPRHWGSTVYEGHVHLWGNESRVWVCSRRPNALWEAVTPGSTAPQGSSGLNYGQPPPSHRGDGSVFSGTSTRLPTYSDVIREQQTRTQRTQTFVAQQRGGRR